MNAVFYVSAVVAIAATCMVITQRRAVHALLYLILSLLAVALVFFTLGAPFVAALEVIIYAGAIMVLFVFVIMMLNLGRQAAEQERHWLGPEDVDRAGHPGRDSARGGRLRPGARRRPEPPRPLRSARTRSACRSSDRTCWAWNSPR